MEKHVHQFSYEVYDSAEALALADAELLKKARLVTSDAYAPYSRFRVGAAARLENGQVVTGTNQENASFPAGICAERVLMSAASSFYPGIPIDTLAISYFNEQGPSENPISPCGICRQSLQEFEQRAGRPIRLILGGQQGTVYIIPQASSLLPLAFTADELE
ncbi:cytidine deaminase [Flavitalea sp. BT771]|uniref:cytidine deaminase n=1 Tax=Flavitalea sp. BT771 TaxID=3063329 RepID=UPI0026E33E7F|nr:cytidine deaminase [Flavitalea sp. BT771]MDO6434631.1 cytidine deaminase [Flavitalea sp. BT771]MDV6223531.1 cytidine deaminase [Flavitalea sp. BT771]